MKIIKITVLGASGFIGSNFSAQLSKFKNFEIHLIGRNVDFLQNKFSSFENINTYSLDIGDTDAIKSVINNSDYIFHFASDTTPFSSSKDPISDIEVNVFKTIRLLEVLKTCNVKKIIFLSSGGAVYGNYNIPIKEDFPKYPLSPYGISKLTMEFYVKYFCNRDNIDFIIFRPSNPFGVGQSNKKSHGLILHLFNSVKNNKTFNIFGDGEEVRDYIYIDDVIDALMKSITYKGSVKIFNLGTGCGYSVNEIVEKVEKIFGIKLNISYQPKTNYSVEKNILDIELVKSELKWQPSNDLESSLIKYMENFKKLP
jgi:UDP-glucose 4-epimerase